MRILLDTHIILWALTADEKLPAEARRLIEDSSNDLYFSLASVWEIEIKYGLGKMPISGIKFYEKCIVAGYNPLKVEVEHIALLSSLKRLENAPKHNDPHNVLQ